MLITIVAGARPNFMKIAPIIHEIMRAKSENHDINFRLIHTGQHYDTRMSDDFFKQLEIPEPHVNLGSGSGSHAEQTATIMIRFEQELIENPTDLVLVVGDVTSTMACAITAQKLQTKVAHVEGGIRSGDWTMPEEINRLVTDSITNYFLTTSEFANNNLRESGVSEDRIFFVGNTMIDTLLIQMPHFRKPKIWNEIGLEDKNYFVMTLHRPANVDKNSQLRILIETLVEASRGLPIIFPIHPRTIKMLQNIGAEYSNLYIVDPMSYLEFNYLVKYAKGVITDSGGITEETSVMGVPCMTLRDNTERPETITLGTNELLGTNPQAIPQAFEKLFSNKWKKGAEIPLWDGNTSKRIVDLILNNFK